MILRAAESLIADAPERARRGNGWPCCTFTAEILSRCVQIPRGDWPVWWGRANVRDYRYPWSSATAALDVVRLVGHPDVPSGRVEPAPDGEWAQRHVERVRGLFVPGRWHFVQLWWSLDENGHGKAPDAKGHAFLWLAVDADEGWRLESDVSRGARLNGSPWHFGPAPNVGTVAADSWLRDADAGVAVVPLWEGA